MNNSFKFNNDHHTVIINKLKDLVNQIDPDIKLENMTGKFNKFTSKKILNQIRNNDKRLLIVCQKFPNEAIFRSNDKNIALFFKNRYIFFDSTIDSNDLNVTIRKMIKEDDSYNHCKICTKSIKESIPCTACGTLICYPCTLQILKNTNMDNTSTLKCPSCQSNSIKFNRTENSLST